MQHAIWEDGLQRLADSRTLRNHPALRHLFLYLAGKELSGDTGELKEYVIGVEALSKPPSYDPQLDAAVRVQISRLRKCLLDYYEKECPEDPVRIDIPKGQFRLSFRLHEAAPAALEAASLLPALERRLRHMAWACATLAALAIAGGVGLLLDWKGNEGSGRPALPPELMAIWRDYVNGERPVMVVLGAPLFAKYTTSETGVFFRDPRLNDWEQVSASPDILKVAGAVGGVHTTASWIYTGVGEATGAFLLSRMLSRSKLEMSLRRSHALSWDDLKERNVIILGAPKHNLQLNHLPFDQHFRLVRGSIHNVRPRQGEPETFRPKFTAGYKELEEDHALISRLPGLHGTGETTVLAGNSTEGTWAAVEFVTQPRYAAELAARLRDEAGRMPRAYQVLVRARFKAQTPVEVNYVSHRLLEQSRFAAAAPPSR